MLLLSQCHISYNLDALDECRTSENCEFHMCIRTGAQHTFSKVSREVSCRWGQSICVISFLSSVWQSSEMVFYLVEMCSLFVYQPVPAAQMFTQHVQFWNSEEHLSSLNAGGNPHDAGRPIEFGLCKMFGIPCIIIMGYYRVTNRAISWLQCILDQLHDVLMN